jgi:soluble lytic murein transglycosylase-like protein
MFDTTTTPTSGEHNSLEEVRSSLRLTLSKLLAHTKTAAHRVLTAAGVCALGMLALLFFRPELADAVKSLSPFSTESVASNGDADPSVDHAVQELLQRDSSVASAASAASAVTAAAEVGETRSSPAADKTIAAHREAEHQNAAKSDPREQKWVTTWLSRRYRVATDATNMLVSSAYMTAKDIKLDPLLILAVMAIESGLNPFAESPVGAQGLMQVMSKVHHAKFEDLGGVKEAFNPAANIKVGSMILKDYVRRSGSVEAGLKMYVGAGAAETDSGYGSRVLAEYQHLKDVAAGKRVPTASSLARAPQKPASVTQPSQAHATAPTNVKDATPEIDAMREMPARSSATLGNAVAMA